MYSRFPASLRCAKLNLKRAKERETLKFTNSFNHKSHKLIHLQTIPINFVLSFHFYFFFYRDYNGNYRT
ncbi:hypothetical protein CVS40_8411 [Lucilia cuprina]|nr:hypothetical protein CVS40_8411 [Lucilia cuprina]